MAEAVTVSRLKRTMLGDIYVAQTDRGVCRIGFGRESERTFIAGLRSLFGPEVRFEERSLPIVEMQLKNYLSGKATSFALEVDLRHLTRFQRQVLRQAMKIPYGCISTYGEIARKIGRPRAYRAVGNALGVNPVPIVIPCHRVVASDGTLGGFGAGLSYKRKLLVLEGVL